MHIKRFSMDASVKLMIVEGQKTRRLDLIILKFSKLQVGQAKAKDEEKPVKKEQEVIDLTNLDIAKDDQLDVMKNELTAISGIGHYFGNDAWSTQDRRNECHFEDDSEGSELQIFYINQKITIKICNLTRKIRNAKHDARGTDKEAAEGCVARTEND